MGKAKLPIIIIVILVFGFVPMVNMPYEVIVQKQVSEEYTTVEPYTVQEKEFKLFPTLTPGETVWAPVTKDVTEYREITKTRLVTRPVVETRTKRVSILRYLLR